jgi:hypothetical protein
MGGADLVAAFEPAKETIVFFTALRWTATGASFTAGLDFKPFAFMGALVIVFVFVIPFALILDLTLGFATGLAFGFNFGFTFDFVAITHILSFILRNALGLS